MMDIDQEEDDVVQKRVYRIKKFIRIREKSLFLQLVKTTLSPKKQLRKTIKSCDITEFSLEDIINNTEELMQIELGSEHSEDWLVNDDWRALWRKIDEDFDHLKNSNQVIEFLQNYTSILKLHVEHRIELDILCYKAMLYCIDPLCLIQIFDRFLINPDDSLHVGCLFDRRQLFAGFDLQEDIDSGLSFEIIMSLTVLLYKSKCKRNKKPIISTMNQNLAFFINRECYKRKFLDIGLKHFLKSACLNGIVETKSLKEFLSNKQKDSSIDSSFHRDSDSESDTWTSSDSSDTSDEERRRRRARIRIRAVNAETSVGQKLKFEEHNELTNMFPLSLKNLSRIAIKNSMTDYTPRSVYTLNMLHNALKDFVLFKDEMDSVKKYFKK